MAPASRIDPKLWAENKERIRELYVVQRKTRQETMDTMSDKYGFIATKAQYVRKLNTWGFSKNASSSDWHRAGTLVKKRKDLGKDSAVVMGGKAIPAKKLKKELGRFANQPRSHQHEILTVSPISLNIVAFTPPSGNDENRTININNIPWIDFQIRVEPYISSMLAPTQSLQMVESQPSAYPSTSTLGDLKDSTQLLSSIPERNSAMMKVFRGNRVQAFLSADQFAAAVKYAIYMSSNDLLPKWAMDDLVTWIIEKDRLCDIEALQRIGGPTIEIFISQVFVSAADIGNLDVVQTLLNLGVCPNSTSSRPLSGHSALYYAVMKGNSRLVKLLLDYGADPNAFPGPEKGLPPLELALSFRSDRNIQVVKTLVDGGANIGYPRLLRVLRFNARFYTVEFFGYLLGDREGSALGLREKLDHNEIQGVLTFALHEALGLEKLDVAQCLLLHGANVHQSPIEHAGDDSVHIKFDLDHYCSTPIQAAARHGNTELVRLLLEWGGSVHSYMPLSQMRWLRAFASLDQEDWDFVVARQLCVCPLPALNYAVRHGNLAMMQLLLEKGANPNFTDGCLETPLQMACQGIRPGGVEFEAIHLLRKWGADVNVIVPGSDAGTALNIAASLGDLELFNLLRRFGAQSTDSAEEEYPSTLQAAVLGGNVQIVELLSSGQPQVLSSNPRLLGYAIRTPNSSEKANMVVYLIEAGCSANDHTWSGEQWEPPLVLAINIAAEELRFEQDIDFHSLQEAVYQKHFGLLDILLDRGADPNQIMESIHFDTPYYISRQVLESLLSHGLDVKNLFPDSTTLFQAVLEAGNTEAAIFLLEHDADFGQWNEDLSESALSEAVYILFKGNFSDDESVLKLIRMLLSRGANVNTCKAVDGDSTVKTESGMELKLSGSRLTVLQMTSLCFWIDSTLFKELLEAGAEINTPASENSGLTALQGAILMGLDEMVKILLDRGANVNAPAARYQGWTTLQAAALVNNDDLVKNLLARGADVNSPAARDGGATALQYAAVNGNLPMAVRFLEAGADVNTPGAENDGRTALEGAAEWGRLDMVHLLLNNDGEVDTLEKRCESAAKYAKEEGHTVIARILRGWKDR